MNMNFDQSRPRRSDVVKPLLPDWAIAKRAIQPAFITRFVDEPSLQTLAGLADIHYHVIESVVPRVDHRSYPENLHVPISPEQS